MPYSLTALHSNSVWSVGKITVISSVHTPSSVYVFLNLGSSIGFPDLNHVIFGRGFPVILHFRVTSSRSYTSTSTNSSMTVGRCVPGLSGFGGGFGFSVVVSLVIVVVSSRTSVVFGFLGNSITCSTVGFFLIVVTCSSMTTGDRGKSTFLSGPGLISKTISCSLTFGFGSGNFSSGIRGMRSSRLTLPTEINITSLFMHTT